MKKKNKGENQLKNQVSIAKTNNQKIVSHQTSFNKKSKHNLTIDFRISGFIHELVKRLHKDHPDKEWSGVGRVVRHRGYYELIDIHFPKQTNVSAHTEIDEEGIEWLTEKIFDEDPTQLQEWNLWIHSHNNMSCRWSGTDEKQRSDLDDGNCSHWFSIVTAYKGEEVDYLGCVDMFRPMRQEIPLNITIESYSPSDYVSNADDLQLSLEGVDLHYKEELDAVNEKIAQANMCKDGLNVQQEDLDKVMEVLNCEVNQEDMEVVRDLCLEGKMTSIDKYIKLLEEEKKGIQKEIEEDKKIEAEKFELDEFVEKIKELHDNEKAPIPVNTWNGFNNNRYGNNGYRPQVGDNFYKKVEEEQDRSHKVVRDPVTQTHITVEVVDDDRDRGTDSIIGDGDEMFHRPRY